MGNQAPSATRNIRPSLLVLEVERADEEAVDVGDLLDGFGGGLPGAVAGLGVHAQHQRVRLKRGEFLELFEK